MPYISVHGFQHYYEWITESGSEPTGKPVLVFIHGWGGSARYWESTALALSDQFDGLLYDMRGFGRSRAKAAQAAIALTSKTSDSSTNSSRNQVTASASDTTAATLVAESPTVSEPLSATELTYEMESYAKDLAALLDALHIQQVYVNAHSMGASVGVFFLNSFPDRVKKAILTCSGIFEYDEKSFTAFHKLGGYVVKFRPRWLYSLPFVDRFFMARFLHRPLSGAISRAFLDDFLMADYDAAVGTIFTSVSKQAAEVMPGEFARLTVPTLLISGERDIIIPADMGRAAAELSDKVEYVVMPDTAHFPMLEDAPTYLQHVREFLKN